MSGNSEMSSVPLSQAPVEENSNMNSVISKLCKGMVLNGPVPLVDAAKSGDIDKVKELIAKGADLNAQMRFSTPLNIAAIKGHQYVVEELIKAGADVNKSVDSNLSPLYYAAQNGHSQIVELLLKAGANVTKPDEPGFTSLWDAASWEYPNILRLLVKYGVPVPDPVELRAKGDLKGADNAEILRQYIADTKASATQDKVRTIIIQKTKKEGAPAIFTDDYVKDQQKLIELRYKLVGDLKQLKSAIEEGQKVVSDSREIQKILLKAIEENIKLTSNNEIKVINNIIDIHIKIVESIIVLKKTADEYYLLVEALDVAKSGEKKYIIATLNKRVERAKTNYDKAKANYDKAEANYNEAETRISYARDAWKQGPRFSSRAASEKARANAEFTAEQLKAATLPPAQRALEVATFVLHNAEKAITDAENMAKAKEDGEKAYELYKKYKTTENVAQLIHSQLIHSKLDYSRITDRFSMYKQLLGCIGLEDLYSYFIYGSDDRGYNYYEREEYPNINRPKIISDPYIVADIIQRCLTTILNEQTLSWAITLYNEQLELLNDKPSVSMNLNEAGPASPKRTKLNTTKYPPILPNSIYNTIIRKYLGGQHKHNTKKHHHVSNRRPTKNTRRY